MTMSVQQRRIVRLLHEGFCLRIVRSLLDNSPVYAEVLNPICGSARAHRALADRQAAVHGLGQAR